MLNVCLTIVIITLLLNVKTPIFLLTLIFILFLFVSAFLLKTYKISTSKQLRLFVRFFYLTLLLCSSVSLFKLQIPYTSSSWYIALNVQLQQMLNFNYPMQYSLDYISTVFVVTITAISLMANEYTFIYLKEDPYQKRFFFFLNSFIVTMLVFVTTNNVFVLFLSWEFLGITSFFLIGHYSFRSYTYKSVIKAFSANRWSDVFFLIFITIYVEKIGSELNVSDCYVSGTLSTLPLFLLIISGFVKSAQNIFFSWLLDSMEAPIPASALIHSATLVAAGIYLVMRFYPHINLNYWSLLFLTTSGLLSAFVFGFLAALQTDIKKMLALSTVANCGFIYFLLGVGQTYWALLYFSVHGLFKSLSFLNAGQLILANKHSQDIRHWDYKSLGSQFMVSLLILSNLFLSGFQFSITISIKHESLNNLNLFFLPYNFVSAVLLTYALISYCYGLKVFSYAIRNNKTFSKKNTLTDWNNISYNYFIFCLLLVLFLISILSYNSLSYVYGSLSTGNIPLLSYTSFAVVFLKYNSIRNWNYLINNFILFHLIFKLFFLVFC